MSEKLDPQISGAFTDAFEANMKEEASLDEKQKALDEEMLPLCEEALDWLFDEFFDKTDEEESFEYEFLGGPVRADSMIAINFQINKNPELAPHLGKYAGNVMRRFATWIGKKYGTANFSQTLAGSEVPHSYRYSLCLAPVAFAKLMEEMQESLEDDEHVYENLSDVSAQECFDALADHLDAMRIRDGMLERFRDFFRRMGKPPYATMDIFEGERWNLKIHDDENGHERVDMSVDHIPTKQYVDQNNHHEFTFRVEDLETVEDMLEHYSGSIMECVESN
jgi:hypothetical protein